MGVGELHEYRYDPLGRRVLTRSRFVGATNNCPCESYIERTVYDGDQVLAELRSSGRPSTDTLLLDHLETADSYDNGDLLGMVLYAHGPGIDQPVHVLKHTPQWYGGSAQWGSITPLTDWNGEYAYGWYPNNSPCVSPGPVCPSFPGYNVTAHGAPPYAGDPPTHSVWAGNLLRGRRDASGLTYLRNRYYDPQTGRFTQLDPIGLAGGLNLYGFAGGDPVNYADPFGLCTPFPECLAQAIADWGASRGGAVGAIALNAGAGLNAAFEASGMNLAGRAGAELRQGDIAAGGLYAAMAFAPIPGRSGGRAVAGKITGFTRHGLNQAISRDGVGVASEAMLGAVRSPVRVVGQSGGKVLYIGENASVVLNESGEVVTTWATTKAGTRIKE
jgi:RHS repeat-associated protein